MCHEHHYLADVRDRLDEAASADEAEPDEDGLPSYLNEESTDDVELLTDGGDE